MRWVYLSCCLLFLVGCASSAVVKEVGPISTSTPVSLDFVLVETSSSLNDVGTNAQLLNDNIITDLRETQIFGTVSGEQADVSSGSGIKIQADITELKPVSPEARTWFGGFAGHARISLKVTVSDLISGKRIQSFETEGESGASARAGTTDEAIQRAAQLVVIEMVRISCQTSQ
jgi:hypothetical protein